MRIRQRTLPAFLLRLVLAPNLRKADEVALRFCVAIDLLVDRLSFRSQRIQQRQVGDTQTAVVRCVLTQSELAVQLLLLQVVVRRRCFEAAVMVGRRPSAGLGPPYVCTRAPLLDGTLSSPTDYA